MNTRSLNLDSGGSGDLYRTASGECNSDGGVGQSRSIDENCLCRFLNGKHTGVHTVFLQCTAILATK